MQYRTHCCPPWWQGGAGASPVQLRSPGRGLHFSRWRMKGNLRTGKVIFREMCASLACTWQQDDLISHYINSARLCWMVSQQCCSEGSEPLARPNPHTVLLTAHTSTWRSILPSCFVGCHSTSLSTGRTPSFPQLLADKTMYQGSTWLLLSPSTSTVIASAFQQELLPKHEISHLKHVITQSYTIVSDRSR